MLRHVNFLSNISNIFLLQDGDVCDIEIEINIEHSSTFIIFHCYLFQNVITQNLHHYLIQWKYFPTTEIRNWHPFWNNFMPVVAGDLTGLFFGLPIIFVVCCFIPLCPGYPNRELKYTIFMQLIFYMPLKIFIGYCILSSPSNFIYIIAW